MSSTTSVMQLGQKLLVGVMVLILGVSLVPVSISTALAQSQPDPTLIEAHAPTNSVIYGVLNDAGDHYADEWAHGIRATMFELNWAAYEPQEGVYNLAYINRKKKELAQLKAQGWYVQLIPGFHYVPEWVFTNYSDMYLVNQYGERWSNASLPGARNLINAPFNPQARALIARFLARVFQDFSGFDAVRVGGLAQGELRYPPPDWNGHHNSYWAFDRHAQNPAESGIPASVIGWRPGIDLNPGSIGRGQRIVNPGFEQMHAHFAVPGWSPEDEVTIALEPRSSGGHALRLSLSTPHRVHQFVRVRPNATYDFGACLRAANSGSWARIFFSQYNWPMQPIGGVPYGRLETNATSWTCKSSRFTVSPTTYYFKVEIDGNQPGTYYFDDLWLKRVDDPDTRTRNIDVPIAFYDWYVQKLTDFQNWQIQEIRKYFGGQLDMVYAGKGIMPHHLTDALTNDMRGNGWSEGNSALYAGAMYDRHVGGLSTLQGIALYNTGIEDPIPALVRDDLPYPGKWSSARWVAHLAHSRGLPVWGENSGQDHYSDIEITLQPLHTFGYAGLLWGFESELYANPNPNDYVSIDEYAYMITRYARSHAVSASTASSP